jgi:glycosyltransferase involved in cell wall biosynthesis
MNRSLQRAQVATCTYATALDLERRHGFVAKDARVVPLGIDTEHFRPSPVVAAGDMPYFFHLSSDDPREHSDVVIEAFAHFLRRHDGPVRLVVAGKLGSLLQPLSDHIARLGVASHVDMPGRVTDQHLVELYSGAAATIVASSNEGFGLQPLEAMACGSLLIAAAAPATEEVAAGGEIEWTSVAVLPMAKALHAAIADPERRERARVVNRRVAKRYSWDATALTLHEMLQELADAEESARSSLMLEQSGHVPFSPSEPARSPRNSG